MMTEDEYLWDRIKHEENLFTSRANFFLVAEALLAAGLANDKLARFFCWLGVGISVLWVLVVVLQGTKTWRPLQSRILQIQEDRNKAGDTATKDVATYYHTAYKKGWLRSWLVMGIMVPALLAIAWLIAALFLLNEKPRHKDGVHKVSMESVQIDGKIKWVRSL